MTKFEVVTKGSINFDKVAIASSFYQEKELFFKAVTSTPYDNHLFSIAFSNEKDKLIPTKSNIEYLALSIVKQGISGPFLAAEVASKNSSNSYEKAVKAVEEVKEAIKAIGTYNIALEVSFYNCDNEPKLQVIFRDNIYLHRERNILLITLPVEVDYKEVVAGALEVKAFLDSEVAQWKAAKEEAEAAEIAAKVKAEADKTRVTNSVVDAVVVKLEYGVLTLKRPDGSQFYVFSCGDYDRNWLVVDGVDVG